MGWKALPTVVEWRQAFVIQRLFGIALPTNGTARGTDGLRSARARFDMRRVTRAAGDAQRQ
jgi:hypothetical protein